MFRVSLKSDAAISPVRLISRLPPGFPLNPLDSMKLDGHCGVLEFGPLDAHKFRKTRRGEYLSEKFEEETAHE
jgi:hypothetical protein